MSKLFYLVKSFFYPAKAGVRRIKLISAADQDILIEIINLPMEK